MIRGVCINTANQFKPNLIGDKRRRCYKNIFLFFLIVYINSYYVKVGSYLPWGEYFTTFVYIVLLFFGALISSFSVVIKGFDVLILLISLMVLMSCFFVTDILFQAPYLFGPGPYIL